MIKRDDFFNETSKTEVLCYNRCGTIKILPYSKTEAPTIDLKFAALRWQPCHFFRWEISFAWKGQETIYNQNILDLVNPRAYYGEFRVHRERRTLAFDSTRGKLGDRICFWNTMSGELWLSQAMGCIQSELTTILKSYYQASSTVAAVSTIYQKLNTNLNVYDGYICNFLTVY